MDEKPVMLIVDDVEINNSESNVAAEQLAWDGTNPLVETFEITNKLDTINVIVAKKLLITTL